MFKVVYAKPVYKASVEHTISWDEMPNTTVKLEFKYP